MQGGFTYPLQMSHLLAFYSRLTKHDYVDTLGQSKYALKRL